MSVAVAVALGVAVTTSVADAVAALLGVGGSEVCEAGVGVAADCEPDDPPDCRRETTPATAGVATGSAFVRGSDTAGTLTWLVSGATCLFAVEAAGWLTDDTCWLTAGSGLVAPDTGSVTVVAAEETC